MIISKLICIPLLILVPLTILFFESHSKDFTLPPSDDVVKQRVQEWQITKPSLHQITNVPSTKLKTTHNSKKTRPSDKPTHPKSTSPESSNNTQSIDLGISPGLYHFQRMKSKRLKRLIQRLDPALYPELIYLANERLLDSAHDASTADIHAAGAYLNKHPRPLRNPDPAMRLMLTIQLNIEPSHYEKAKVLSTKIGNTIFWGAGGTLQPDIKVQKSTDAKSTITIAGNHRSLTTAIPSLADTEKMLANAIQIIVTKTIKTNKLPILHTDKIHYSYFSRRTWHQVATSLSL